MSDWSRLPEHRWPRFVAGTGLVLGAFVGLEILRFPVVGDALTLEFLIGLATSAPFIALLVVEGFRMDTRVSPARHRRVGGWMVGGLTVFLLINLVLMPLFPRPHLYEYVAWVRWAAVLGGGTGVLVGGFEAKAIDRELTAERRRIRNEELEAQRARLEEFASILSHDLRNPLNVAAGNVDLAIDGDSLSHLGQAKRALDRMDTIIDETLLLAQSGLVIGDPDVVSLAVVAEDCWQNVATGDATLTVDDPPTIVADESRLHHLFENLFRNAIQHGGPDVTIRVGALPNEAGFFVEDDGPGIDRDERTDVFTAGYTTSASGTGFGLAIVDQIADAHGWDATITESDTGGARFEFTGVDVRPGRPPASTSTGMPSGIVGQG